MPGSRPIAEPKLPSVVKIAGKQERNTAEEAALAATLAELGLTEETPRPSTAAEAGVPLGVEEG